MARDDFFSFFLTFPPPPPPSLFFLKSEGVRMPLDGLQPLGQKGLLSYRQGVYSVSGLKSEKRVKRVNECNKVIHTCYMK